MTAKAMLRTATTVLRRLMMDDDGGSMTAVPPAAAVVLDDDNVSEAKSGAFDASVVGRFKETTSPNCGEVVVVVELTVVLAALSERGAVVRIPKGSSRRKKHHCHCHHHRVEYCTAYS